MSPVPSPDPSQSITPLVPSPGTEPTPPPTVDVGNLIDVANLALQISVGIVTALALVLALLAFLGVREIGIVRKRHEDVKQALGRIENTREALERRLVELEHDLETMVLTAHLFSEGQSAYKAADYDRAISFYEEALRLQPDNNRIKVRLGRALVYKGLIARAERLLRAAIKHDGANADAWRALSTCRRYVDRGDAIRCAEKAIDLESTSPDNWNYLGLLLRDDTRHEEALSAFQEAEKLNVTDPISSFYQGLVLTRLGRNDEGKHKLYEAQARSEALQRTNRIKQIWALTVEWGYRRSLDTPDQEVRSNEIALDLAGRCKEKRDREAVIGHMVFYIRAIGQNPDVDASLSAFPPDDVHHVCARIAS